MPDQLYFRQELYLLNSQKRQAEKKLAEYKGKPAGYSYGYWWGTLCQINSQISTVEARIEAKSALQRRSPVNSLVNESSPLF